jgi:hypothetical protein
MDDAPPQAALATYALFMMEVLKKAEKELASCRRRERAKAATPPPPPDFGELMRRAVEDRSRALAVATPVPDDDAWLLAEDVS